MSLKTEIDKVHPYAKGWNRSGVKSILSLFQEGQDILLDANPFYTRYLEEDNKGFPPYMTITDKTVYKYSITPTVLTNITSLVRNINGTDYTVRAKQILDVFVDVSEWDYQSKWIGRPATYYYPNPYSTETDRTVVSSVPVSSVPRVDNTAPYLIFREAPEEGTEKYFIDFTWEAPRLTSESIPLVLPVEYHRALRWYAMGEIQMLENGKFNEFQQRFEEIKQKFQNDWSTRGAQSDNMETIPVD